MYVKHIQDILSYACRMEVKKTSYPKHWENHPAKQIEKYEVYDNTQEFKDILTQFKQTCTTH